MADKKRIFDEDEPRIIKLRSDEGEEVELQLVDIATVNGKDYALLAPPENEDEYTKENDYKRNVTLMHFIKNGDEYTFAPIQDDREFEEVSKILEKEYGDEDE